MMLMLTTPTLQLCMGRLLQGALAFIFLCVLFIIEAVAVPQKTFPHTLVHWTTQTREFVLHACTYTGISLQLDYGTTDFQVTKRAQTKRTYYSTTTNSNKK